MLDVRNIRFARAAGSPRDFPRDGRPQVCFAGRSNVGKSSLLNTLVGRTDLARISKTPGRTREIHFYELADKAYFVDLPGYGYAKVSLQMREQWRRLVESYVTRNEALRLMVAILDIRHDPTQNDLDLVSWVESCGIPYVVVLTKLDKVSGNEAARQHRRIVEALAAAAGERERPVIRFSAKTGAGRSPLLQMVLTALGLAGPRPGPASPERASDA